MEQPKWASAQVALRAEGWIAIDVDHYGDKTGGDQLKALEAKLGELPRTITSTARGADSPSRQRFYAVPEDQTFVSKPAPDIEVVQFHHRYSIVSPSVHEATETPYVWYDADGHEMWGYPSVAEFTDLPAAWLEYLSADKPTTHEGFSGSIEDWLNTLVPGDPTQNVTDLVEQLPTENFTHDDVIRILWKVVRLGAEGHSGIRWALEEIERKWVKPPFDSENYRRELAVAVEGAVAKGGALEVPELLEGVAVASKVNHRRDLETLLFGDQTDKGRDESRRTLIRELYRAGLTPQEILTLVWFSKTHTYEHRADLWHDVLDFEPQADTLTPTATNLLSADERKRLQYIPNFIDQYLFVAKLREESPNLPYHEMNAWAGLALTLGKLGVIPKKGSFGGMNLNFYCLIVGETTSGKGESKHQLLEFLTTVCGKDSFDDMDIGGDPSPEAIHRKLIERSGDLSWFNTDEADQILARMRDTKGYSSGLESKLTDWYEGRVGKRLRNSDPDSDKSATTYLNMWLMGTPVRVLGAFDRKQIESGFLARFITAFGNPRKITDSSLETREDTEEAVVLGYNPYVRELAEEMAEMRRKLARRRIAGRLIPVRQNSAAKARLSEARQAMHRAYRDHRMWDLLEPMMVRMGDNVWKAAALIALSNGRYDIVEADVLVALRSAETWLENLVKLVEGVSANDWSREVDKVHEFISKRAKVSEARLYSQFNDKKKHEMDAITESLKAQKKIRLSNGAWEAIPE